MYCSSCGSQIGEGLNFCSRCGKRVQELQTAAPNAADNLYGGLGYIGAGGFVGFVVILAILLKRGVPPEFVTAIAFLYLATLFGICFMVLRQAEFFSGKKERSDGAAADHHSPQVLRPVITAQLNESKDHGVGSVTEHTTRTLDSEAFVERK
jgi:hypothetical protein